MGTLGQCQGSFNFKNGKQNGKTWRWVDFAILVRFWETPLFPPICRFGQPSTKNLSLFQLFQPQPPILSPPSSNLIPIGYALNAGKWRVWRKFRGKPPFLCHPPTHLPARRLSQRNQLWQKRKTDAGPILKGIHCRDSKSQLSRCFSILSRMYLFPLFYTPTAFLCSAGVLSKCISLEGAFFAIECIWPKIQQHPRTKAGDKYLIPENWKG